LVELTRHISTLSSFHSPPRLERVPSSHAETRPYPRHVRPDRKDSRRGSAARVCRPTQCSLRGRRKSGRIHYERFGESGVVSLCRVRLGPRARRGFEKDGAEARSQTWCVALVRFLSRGRRQHTEVAFAADVLIMPLAVLLYLSAYLDRSVPFALFLFYRSSRDLSHTPPI
jgi:hypothetical protein